MENISDFDTPRLKRKMRKSASPKSVKNRSIRGNPEGNSIVQREKVRLSVAPTMSNDSGLSSLKKKKQKFSGGDNLDEFEERYLSKKSKKLNKSVESSSSLDQTTPDTLSEISSIAAISDVTMHTTLTRLKKPRAGRADVTWENAVTRARGEPDGAEKSFHAKKANKSVIKDDFKGEREADVNLKENKPNQPNKPLERKKSFKVQLKHAANKLKSLRSKGRLENSRAGQKRKLDVSLPDESAVAMKKTKTKEISWKERRQQRKMTKNNFDVIQKTKVMHEDLRRHDLPQEKREKMCQELYEMVKGKVIQFAMAHDTARVLQCLIQYGTNDYRVAVMEEMKDEIVSMCKSKYAKFVIRKLIKYGSKQQRSFVIKSFHGNIRKMMRHREASAILEFAYNDYANASQRLSMMEEFYGPSFALFKSHDTKSLNQIMLEQPDKKDMILSNMKEALLPMIDKEILLHSMVHKVFYDFFHYAHDKVRKDMIESLREHLGNMLHTRDGSRVAMHCLWHGTPKDRKIIIRSFKTHVVKICKEEYGHLALLAMFDCVDDTRLVSKAILDEMLKSLHEVAQDQYGRKVLLYLLSPRDPLHFHPDVVHILQEGDNNAFSKKDGRLRSKELQDHVSSPLLQYIVNNARDLITNSAAMLLILATITHADGDPSAAMEAIAKIAAEPFTAGSSDHFHIVEDSAGHLTLKRLILNDKERKAAGEEVLFSNKLLEALPGGALKSWAACNRGCFALVSLLEVQDSEITACVKQQLTGVRKSLKKMTFTGAQILIQKLDSSSPGKPQMIDL